jgi:hypothetical protein
MEAKLKISLRWSGIPKIGPPASFLSELGRSSMLLTGTVRWFKRWSQSKTRRLGRTSFFFFQTSFLSFFCLRHVEWSVASSWVILLSLKGGSVEIFQLKSWGHFECTWSFSCLRLSVDSLNCLASSRISFWTCSGADVPSDWPTSSALFSKVNVPCGRSKIEFMLQIGGQQETHKL